MEVVRPLPPSTLRPPVDEDLKSPGLRTEGYFLHPSLHMNLGQVQPWHAELTDPKHKHRGLKVRFDLHDP